MKKNILKIILFILIFCVLLNIVSYPFIPKNNSQEYGMEDADADVYGILGEPDNTIDVIIYGDSESITSFVPIKMWADLGYTSYICGTPGQAMPAVCEAILNTTQHQTPKYIVLEVNNMFVHSGVTAPMAKVANTLFPVLEYHDRWKDLTARDFGKIEYTITNDNKGYHYIGATTPIDSTGYMSYSEGVQEIAIEHKVYLKLIKEYCKMKGIDLILYSAPNVKNWTYEKHNGLDNFCQKEGIEYIDFNYITNEIGIDWTTDTGDYGEHVNHNGALKVTKYFEKYLKNKGKLKSHKEDDNYRSWNKIKTTDSLN